MVDPYYHRGSSDCSNVQKRSMSAFGEIFLGHVHWTIAWLSCFTFSVALCLSTKPTSWKWKSLWKLWHFWLLKFKNLIKDIKRYPWRLLLSYYISTVEKGTSKWSWYCQESYLKWSQETIKEAGLKSALTGWKDKLFNCSKPQMFQGHCEKTCNLS